MDSNNPVVKLCAKGMEREGRGDFDAAAQLFMEAWQKATDDFEHCIAAHYVARHQKNPLETLMWNQRSLNHADAVRDDRVREFYPSLYLNMGKAHEDLGQREDAKRFYELAANAVSVLGEGRYGDIVRDAVSRGLQRVA
jgi:tetratricopeptide (TPR) repeat protein